MKILLATFFNFPKVGGVWTYINHLKKGLEMNGCTVDILARKPDTNDLYLLDSDIKVEYSKLFQFIKPKMEQFYSQVKDEIEPFILQREIEKCCFERSVSQISLEDYDIIHAQDVVSSHTISRTKPFYIPLITTIHGSLHYECVVNGLISEHNSFSNRYLKELEYNGAAQSNCTIVPSKWMKSYLNRCYQVPQKNLTVIHNGMDIENFRLKMKEQKRLDTSHDKFILASVGRLSKEKGHQHLLEALGKLISNRSDWVFWLLGDGPLKQSLQEQCEKLGISNHVVFWGYREDVPALLKNVDILIHPSHRETLSYTLQEAQVAGLPIVASHVGGVPEVVTHQKTGILYPYGDIEQLVQCILNVLDNPKLRLFLGENAQKQATKKWSYLKMTDKVMKLYEKHLYFKTKEDESE